MTPCPCCGGPLCWTHLVLGGAAWLLIKRRSSTAADATTDPDHPDGESYLGEQTEQAQPAPQVAADNKATA